MTFILEKGNPYPYFLRDYRKAVPECQHTLTAKSGAGIWIKKRVGKKPPLMLNSKY
jgi:hypothetical protein